MLMSVRIKGVHENVFSKREASRAHNETVRFKHQVNKNGKNV
jgi:hypothetical protein